MLFLMFLEELRVQYEKLFEVIYGQILDGQDDPPGTKLGDGEQTTSPRVELYQAYPRKGKNFFDKNLFLNPCTGYSFWAPSDGSCAIRRTNEAVTSFQNICRVMEFRNREYGR